MRPVVRSFIEQLLPVIPASDPVFEFGSYQVPGQEDIGNLRDLFPGRNFVGCDMRAGPGVDRVLDLHRLDLASDSVGTAVCLETFEHVERPWDAAAELHRVLAPNGVLLLSSVMNFPIHGYPSDYWRFTPQAFMSLLRAFDTVLVAACGDPLQPHSVVAVAAKGQLPDPERVRTALQSWSETRPTGRDRLRSFTPPALVTPVRRRRIARGVGDAVELVGQVLERTGVSEAAR